MALDWSAAAQAQLAGGIVRPVVLFRVATPTPIRLWAGVGWFETEADVVEETDNARYLGMGEFVGLPPLQQLINGQADRVEFRMSGAPITPQVAALASTESASVRGAAVNVGLRVLGADLQPISPTAWLWEGEGDTLSVERDGSGANAVRTIVLSVGTVMTGRRRPKNATWTDPDQKHRSSDDRFCERVGLYSQGTTKTWPH